ncbi:MAG: hypothetical protein AB8B86_06655 [Pseudomonadales bacterium]
MSARGLCNQEIAAARKLIENASSATLRRAGANQLLFAYRCFLLELAELYRLSVTVDYLHGDELLTALREKLGSDSTIAELEAFEKSAWRKPLELASSAQFALQTSEQSIKKELNDKVIRIVQLADSYEPLSTEVLNTSLRTLTSLVQQMRELGQEY